MSKSRTKSSPTAGPGGGEVFELVPRRLHPRRIDGLIIGTVTGVADAGVVSVDFAENPSGRPLAARSTVRVTSRDVGREVALMFEAADCARPIVVGVISRSGAGSDDTRDIELDGDRIVFTAQRELVLRCGKSTVTLTRAGKILIQGAYLLSRSSGVNRIKGGSVQIN